MLQHRTGVQADLVELSTGRDETVDRDGASEDALLVEVRDETVHEAQGGGLAGTTGPAQDDELPGCDT